MFLHCPTTNYKERTDPVVSNTSLSMGGSILTYELRQLYWLVRCYAYTGAFLQDLSKKKACPQHVGWEWELSPGIMTSPPHFTPNVTALDIHKRSWLSVPAPTTSPHVLRRDILIHEDKDVF